MTILRQQTTTSKINGRSYFLIGLAAQMAYVTAEMMGGYFTPGYNYLDNTASELMAIGSVDRHYFIPLYLLHAFFIGVFGVGLIRQFPYRSNKRIHTGAVLLVILGVTYGLACSIFPMDPPDTKYSKSGYMHIILIGIGTLSLLFSIPKITHGIYEEYNWKLFKSYTRKLLPFLILCGILSPIILYTKTPLMGLAERIVGHLSSLWLLVLSYGLMKEFPSIIGLPIEPTVTEISDVPARGISELSARMFIEKKSETQ